MTWTITDSTGMSLTVTPEGPVPWLQLALQEVGDRPDGVTVSRDPSTATTRLLWDGETLLEWSDIGAPPTVDWNQIRAKRAAWQHARRVLDALDRLRSTRPEVYEMVRQGMAPIVIEPVPDGPLHLTVEDVYGLVEHLMVAHPGLQTDRLRIRLPRAQWADLRHEVACSGVFPVEQPLRVAGVGIYSHEGDAATVEVVSRDGVTVFRAEDLRTILASVRSGAASRRTRW